MRFLARGHRRRFAGIHEECRLARLDSLIAGMRCVRDRRAAGIVIGQNRGQQIDRRRAHSVELRKVSVVVPEKAQHRHYTVDGIVKRLRRLQLARGEELTQRQQIGEQFDQSARITADMTAIWQDLCAQFFDQAPDVAAQMPGLSLHAKGRVGESDH